MEMSPTKGKWLCQSPKKSHSQTSHESTRALVCCFFYLANLLHQFLVIIVLSGWGLRIPRCTSYAHFVALVVGYSYLFFFWLAYIIFRFFFLLTFALPFLTGYSDEQVFERVSFLIVIISPF